MYVLNNVCSELPYQVCVTITPFLIRTFDNYEFFMVFYDTYPHFIQFLPCLSSCFFQDQSYLKIQIFVKFFGHISSNLDINTVTIRNSLSATSFTNFLMCFLLNAQDFFSMCLIILLQIGIQGGQF